MSYMEVEDFDVKMMEESDEDGQSSELNRPNFAVVTLQDTNEVMVTASEWLNTDKTQCYWPPFKSPEKMMEAVKNRLEPSTSGKPWELLNIFWHADYDTYEEAVKKREEVVKPQTDGMFAVITLQESNELTVIPSNWLNEQKTQCYWPPNKSPEMCLEAIKKKCEPERGRNHWAILNIVLHGEYATYEQAKEKHKEVCEQMEWPSFGSCEKQPEQQTSKFTQTFGIKRKHDVSPDILLTTDMDTMKEAMLIMHGVKKKVQDISSADDTITTLQTQIEDDISKMNKGTRRKATVGIFGRTGEGKSSLLNAVLGHESLLPSGCSGACTALVTQVEANLIDSNYTAEIEFIPKEEWENEIETSDRCKDNLMTETVKERIIALYGADAEEKTLEELKRDPKYNEIDNVLSTRKKTISSSNPSEFANSVSCYLENSSANPGGWYWPIVKSVVIKIPDCHELLEHIVLIDIPGTGDCNKIRDDLWKTKLRECSSVWIVSDIKRADAAKDPWGIIEHCIEDLGPAGECKYINFICTKTDDIKPAEYLRSAKLTEAQIPRHDLDLKTNCILHRNDQTKTAIKQKLKTKMKESKERFITEVFTVSSLAFNEQPSHLKPDDNEMPKLRDVLKSLNKSIKEKLTRDYVNEAKGILSFIQSVQQDIPENMIKDKVLKDLQRNLEKELKMLDGRLETLHDNLERCLSKGVEQSVTLCLKTTNDMLSSVRPRDNRGFHKIYRALCERKGCYWPRNKDEPIDLNKYLTKHLYDAINEEFQLMFPVDDNDKTEKSMQKQVDQFNIIQDVFPPMLHQAETFIRSQETKLKVSLSRDIIEKKKKMFSSMYTTIQKKMAPGYNRAAEKKGDGAMKRMEETIADTIEQLKHQMFNEAKVQMLQLFNDLRKHIMKTLESGLKNSLERSLSQTSKVILLDVYREIKELERLSQLL